MALRKRVFKKTNKKTVRKKNLTPKKGLSSASKKNQKKPSLISKKTRRAPLYLKKNSPPSTPLQRFEGNPIISPREKNNWESKATFNPGAVRVGDKTHLFYRAIGDDDMSVWGHASSADGISFDERSEYPVYYSSHVAKHKSLKESHLPRFPYVSGGGGWGGAEDPRATKIGDRVYVTYTEFNGYEAPRVAITSIDVQDLLKKHWNWKEAVPISPPGESHKNWVLFPEKINGKFALLHSITPHIQIDYFDDLDFDGGIFVRSKHISEERKGAWDSRIRGVGAPPLKTKAGWLLLYHATDDRDPGRYKIGAMILDLKDPTRILYRSSSPLLSPDEEYENAGYKWGVIYTCGAVILDNVLFVYYGGADSVGCVATADLDEFLKELKRTGAPKMKTSFMRKG